MNKKYYSVPKITIDTRIKIDCHICDQSVTTNENVDYPDGPGGPGMGEGEPPVKGRGSEPEYGNIW